MAIIYRRAELKSLWFTLSTWLLFVLVLVLFCLPLLLFAVNGDVIKRSESVPGGGTSWFNES